MQLANCPYRFVVADTEELKNACYRIRYQVYVEEFKFEKAEEHPDGMEHDEYDDDALHCLALDESGEPVGTARVVLDSSRGFPIENIPGYELDYGTNKPSRHLCFEASRVAVLRDHRRGTKRPAYGVDDTTPGSGDNNQQQEGFECVVGLFLWIFKTALQRRLEWMYMITEDRVHKLCCAYGFGDAFRTLGPRVDYHGSRVPYLASVLEFLNLCRKNNPKFGRLAAQCLTAKDQ